MKFKIDKIYQSGNNLQVEISHQHCPRQIFSMPIKMYENNEYLKEIKKQLKDRYENTKQVNITKSIEGQEIDTNE